jgi:molybdopterin molybdotransferase
MDAGPAEVIAIEQAVGRVLAEDVFADRDQPPFDRVAMDGIAIVARDLGSADTREFRIAGRLSPGRDAPDGSAAVVAGDAIEVMTGAALPPPWDAVVPWEALEADAPREDAVRHVRAHGPVRAGANLHPRADDYRQGDRLAVRGQRISAPHIHVLASVGCATVSVAPLPRIALVATGDELVPVDAEPGPQQIRMSNMAAIAACLERAGFSVRAASHSPDGQERLRDTIGAALAVSDVTLISGAVSKGSKDFVPAVLAALGCERWFHGIAQKPGKPMWFGTSPGGGVVVGLPGNPVSSLVCFVRYVLPALRAWGQPQDGVRLAGSMLLPLVDPVEARPDCSLLLPTELGTRDDGASAARVRKGSGSGNYAGLIPSDGIVEIPAGTGRLGSGSPVRCFPWP